MKALEGVSTLPTKVSDGRQLKRRRKPALSHHHLEITSESLESDPQIARFLSSASATSITTQPQAPSDKRKNNSLSTLCDSDQTTSTSKYNQVPTRRSEKSNIMVPPTAASASAPAATATMSSKLLLTSVIFLIIALTDPPRIHYNWHTSNLYQNQHYHKLVKATTLIDSVPGPEATATTTTSRKLQRQVQASFSTPNQAINITHVTYDPIHDTVYLGATNAIYQLNGSDLTVQHEQSTGPVFDNPSCGITECHGYEDLMKPTQNVNKVLVIDYKHKKLLSCGSTKQGACRRYQLNNIAQKEDLIPMAVAANDDNSSTYAFIAPARYTYDPASTSPATSANSGNNSNHLQPLQHQQVLYVAATYTKVGQSRELLVPAIGTRVLDDGPNSLKLYENSFLDSARIDINSHLRDYFLVNYLYGFASSNYIYFITVQKKATSRDFEELGYHTRLARICITDSSYNSYTEVDLKCVPNRRKAPQQPKQGSSYFNSNQNQQQFNQPTDYPLLQDAILVDAGSQLLQSLAQNDQLSSNFFPSSGGTSPDDNKVLLGVFSSAKDHTQHAGDHSALCAFSLAQIEDKFNDNIHSCYTGRMQSRNMEYIAGNVQECPKSGQGGNVVNFCHETLKINGTIPIVSEASISYFNTTLTAITATSHINSQAKNIYSEQLASELAINSSNILNSNKKDSTVSFNAFSSNGGSANSRQHTVVFVGTSNGHIKKILLNNASNGIEFDDVQVDTNAILSDLHLHSSGNQLIAATPYKVMKVPTHNCAQYSTCRECSQSKNPYCGWCLLKKSCTTKSECVSATIGADLVAAPTASGVKQQQQVQQQPQQQQPKWISTESSGKCIDLQSIVPDKIPMTSTGKVDLYIDRLPRLPKEHSYKCIFNRSEQTSATPTPFGLSCPLPKLMDRQRHIQIEPGRDHAVVELAVRSSETNTDFLDGKITFFDCQRHTTCKDCLTTNWGCNWCLNENVCLFNTSKCDKSSQQQQRHPDTNSLVQLLGMTQPMATNQQQQQAIIVAGSGSTRSPVSLVTTGGPSGGRTGGSSNTIGLVQQCPTFDVGHQQDILLADGSEKELSIRVKNMPQFKGSMKCVVEIESYEISLKAKIYEDRVICENSNYTYAADVGLLNGQLKVIYSDNNILIDRTNFTLYKCHLLGSYLNRPDCSLCQRIDQRFNCGWCSGSCKHKSRCLERPDDRCPPPRIDFIHPLSGPSLGGTRVTIEGSNLGQTFDEIASRVTIGNVPCKPIEEEYKASNKIVCITSPVVARFNHQPIVMHGSSSPPALDLIAGDIVVGNKAGYSIAPAKFQFKSIYLRDYTPRYGPQSGGTRLTLTGMNLDIGSSVQVFLDELPCLIEPNSVSSEQLVCRTSASRQSSRPINRLKLVIDDAQIVRDDDVFYYTADPTVTKISPLRAYLSGGRPINVFGANLTVVAAPRMAIHDLASGKKINETLCIVHDDTRMQCPSPAVNLQLMDLEYSEQHLGSASGSTYEPSTTSQSAAAPSASPSPVSSDGNGDSSNNKQLLLHQQQVLQHDESVRFRLSFIMDWVPHTAYPQLHTEIAYTSDPKLYPFASAQYKAAQELDQVPVTAASGPTASWSSNGAEQQFLQQQQPLREQQTSYQIEADTYLLQPGGEPSLVLYGEHLRAAVSEYEITVTVGQDLCNLTRLTQNRLVCVVPLDHMATPTDEDGHQTQRLLPLVVVRIGFNLRYELGYVQYHPLLVEQIVSLMMLASNSSQQMAASSSQQAAVSFNGANTFNTGQYNQARRFVHPDYPPQYMPRETESALQKVSSFLGGLLMLVAYTLMATLLFAFVYSSVHYGLRLKQQAQLDSEQRAVLAKVDLLERSLRPECRVASLALQGDLNELEHHVNLTGVPLLNVKYYIMKVFFPGMTNHPLLLRDGNSQHQNQRQQQQQVLLNNGASIDINQHHNHQQQYHQTVAQMAGPNQVPFGCTIDENLVVTNGGNSATSTAASASADFPMEYFERLILTKPFLLTFINTLERQASFTIRDKVNVASLIMIVLMDRLDYATDVMKTLLFQLVERSVNQLNSPLDDEAAAYYESQIDRNSSTADAFNRVTRKLLSRRASNLLSGLPIAKRQQQHQQQLSSNRVNFGKTGSASSLMASTSVAAQMLLARVGHKTAPVQDQQCHQNSHVNDGPELGDSFNRTAQSYYQHLNQSQSSGAIRALDCKTIAAGGACSEYMSTTAFNATQQQSVGQQHNNNRMMYANRHAGGSYSASSSSACSSLSSRRRHRRHLRAAAAGSSRRRASSLRLKRRQAQLMLRRTDSVVEKMLTNWLALNMYDQLHGQAGHSLYMLFEALKCQLERGPVDAISGDAYYSLNEHKLLRDPAVHFEVVNLYVIVDTDILHAKPQHVDHSNLLLDNSSTTVGLYDSQQQQHQQAVAVNRFNGTSTMPGAGIGQQHQQHQRNLDLQATSRRQQQQQHPSATITLALRVLDCDTIGQVKAKILSSLYRNAPSSVRLGVADVELSLRQHQPPGQMSTGGGAQTLAHPHQQQQQQYVTIVLNDDDLSSLSSFNGQRRLNTLRHYGLTDQGIMMLKRNSAPASNNGLARGEPIFADMLADDHYSNPYAEIQYGHCVTQQHQSNNARFNATRSTTGPQQTQANLGAANGDAKWWHLSQRQSEPADRTSGQISDHSNDSSSSPSSHSPSMMLLANHHDSQHKQQQQHQNVAKFRNGPAFGANGQQQQQPQAQFYHPSSLCSSSASSTGNVLDTNSTSANSRSAHINSSHLMLARAAAPANGQQVAGCPDHLMQHDQQQQHLQQQQQPIYCQIGSVSANSQHNVAAAAANGSSYYCQIGQSAATIGQSQHLAATSLTGNNNFHQQYRQRQIGQQQTMPLRMGGLEQQTGDTSAAYLSRMLTTKGTIQKYIDDFFKTILTVRPEGAAAARVEPMQLYDDATYGGGLDVVQSNLSTTTTTTASRRPGQNGACPPAVKWIFDLLDEAAARNGITDQSVVHAWKSNAFLLRFWVNFVKNPNYILDVDKSTTLDASLSVIAQTLMDSCAPPPSESAAAQSRPDLKGDNNRLIFAKDLPKYKELVKRFYQDVASMPPVSDQEMVRQMSSLAVGGGGAGSQGAAKFDTNLALKELCVYAVNYGAEMIESLNGDYACQQMELAQQLEQCFRSFTIFEAYQ